MTYRAQGRLAASILGSGILRRLPRKVVEPPPEPKQICGNPDCRKPSVGTYCSAECCRHFKANFRSRGGRNVRITEDQ